MTETVFVLSGGYSYEGSEPLGVFRTVDGAKAFAQKQEIEVKRNGIIIWTTLSSGAISGSPDTHQPLTYDYYEIVELQVLP